MTTPDGAHHRAGWAGWLRPGLLPWAAAFALMLLPDRTIAPLRDWLALTLRPGQRVASRARDASTAAVRRVRIAATAADRAAQLEEQNRSLTSRSRQLELALQLLRTEAATLRNQSNAGVEPTAGLLTTRPLEARLLGGQARGLLERRAVLDVGTGDGVADGSLVLSETMLDLGSDAEVDAGDLVLLGGEVWGQIASVDGWTSTARHVAQPGYRDLVQLAQASGDRLRPGPRGVLEGTGEPLCRIRMIAVTEPVSVGDVVLTDGGSLPAATLCYGRVVRVEQPRGAAHWEIWMQPAIASAELRGTVAVLRTELNTARVGDAPSIHTNR